MNAPAFVSGFAATIPEGDALWAAFRGADLLVKMGPRKRGRLLRTEEFQALGIAPVRIQYVGKLGELPVIAAELSPSLPDVPGLRFGGFRAAYFWLESNELAAAGTAFQIQYWDQNHRYCAGCGAELVAKTTERAKRCEKCSRDYYPPVTPATIVLVERGNEILMTRQARFPKGMYGLVAGFLEPGETLEACVAREAMEETGISIKNVRYFGSQPWPFPHQVMIGFTAEYASGEIVVDTSELEEAVWFDRETLKLSGTVNFSQPLGEAPSGPMLPPPFSIARQLIDHWLGIPSVAQG